MDSEHRVRSGNELYVFVMGCDAESLFRWAGEFLSDRNTSCPRQLKPDEARVQCLWLSDACVGLGEQMELVSEDLDG